MTTETGMEPDDTMTMQLLYPFGPLKSRMDALDLNIGRNTNSWGGEKAGVSGFTFLLI